MSSRLTSRLSWSPRTLEAGKRAIGISTNAVRSAGEVSSDSEPSYYIPLPPRENSVYLLHVAAEVEHALMVQYLYAAFSLGGDQVPADMKPIVRNWRDTILSIAREEMGHLATVQNLLQLIGGPVTFEREDFPIPSDLYPFDFTLEALTQKSLAKYVLAEMPDDKSIDANGLRAEIDAIKVIADWDTAGKPVHPVGAIYLQVSKLLQLMANSDFSADSVARQVRPDEWSVGHADLLILSASSRAQALTALTSIAEQGEGAAMDPTMPIDKASHFFRFLNIYRHFPADGSWKPARDVATNPTALMDPSRGQTKITNQTALAWAELANLRYRMLLAYLSHAFYLEGASGVAVGKSPRGLLVSLAFGEMYHLRAIGDILVGLPVHKGAGKNAGLPFDMPYSLALPNQEADRWRLHRDLLSAARDGIDVLLKEAGAGHEAYLKATNAADIESQATCLTIIGH